MIETRSALAELAKRLRNGLYINPNDKRFDGPVIVRTLDANDVLAAHRIVAELAKVSDGHWEVICDGPPAYFCTAGDLKVQCAIGRCRAIAEEGAEDGFKRD